MKKNVFSLFFILIFSLTISGCSFENSQDSIYANKNNWAYLETEDTSHADVFFICPTVYSGTKTHFNMPIDDQKTKEAFLGAINMEKGIYDDETRFFAPYYQQAGLNVYELPVKEREKYLTIAYSDIKEAFLYYLEHYNQNNPIILAGFSQGADMCIRLLKEDDIQKKIADQLIACYAIGWGITEQELDQYPKLKMANREDDTGVIISFNSESIDTTDSLLIPNNTHTVAINPINWKTDDTLATKEENKGSCFTDYQGTIIKEIPQLTGAYLDPVRGSLKVTDISSVEYPPVLSIFSEGIYHLYDYQFFYRNLEENVQTRLQAYYKRSNLT